MEALITFLVRLLFLALGTLITYYLLPWLRDKRLYEVVRHAVQAAEKLGESLSLDKKEYVCELLRSAGYTVTPYCESLIEGCVMELDLALAAFRGEKKPAEEDKGPEWAVDTAAEAPAENAGN